MTIHKWTKLTPIKRQEMANKYFKEGVRIDNSTPLETLTFSIHNDCEQHG
jgi:hypothetical protein